MSENIWKKLKKEKLETIVKSKLIFVFSIQNDEDAVRKYEAYADEKNDELLEVFFEGVKEKSPVSRLLSINDFIILNYMIEENILEDIKKTMEQADSEGMNPEGMPPGMFSESGEESEFPFGDEEIQEPKNPLGPVQTMGDQDALEKAFEKNKIQNEIDELLNGGIDGN